MDAIADFLNKIPGEIYAALATLGIGFLAHKRFLLEHSSKIKETEKNKQKAWFEVELEYVVKNQETLQKNLDISINRLEKDREYQDEKIEQLQQELQDLLANHAKCQKDYIILMEKYTKLLNRRENENNE